LTSPSNSPPVFAVYFDGRQSTPWPVTIGISSGRVRVSGAGIAREERLADVEITEPLGTTPRLIRFRDGAFCSIDDRGSFAALLAAQRVRVGRGTQWEGGLRWAAGAAAVFVLLLILGYRYALPGFAALAAERVPQPVVDVIGRETLSALDRSVFEPSAIAESRRDRLLQRFTALRFPDHVDPRRYEILFRKSDLLGPNAMALPSGTIVVTDALVELTGDDDDLLSVLAHEAGHVERRHGMRQLFQNSAVALAVTWLVGDISMLAAAAPTALLQARYSRELERDADRYAVDVLDLNRIPRDHFARMLRRLQESVGEDATAGDGSVLDYLSSHPVTSERIENLQK
jgi:Zn-dependent protease with chaperone function